MSKLPISALAAIAGLFLATPAVAQDPTPATQPAPDPARLAAAKVTVDYIFPAGTYAKMFGGSFSQLMDQSMNSVTAMPMADLMRSTGLSQDRLAKLGKGTLADVMEIMDPAFKQRQKATMDAMMPVLSNMMASLEPSMREGLAAAYARYFTLDQLSDMNRFFATPSGTAYARNSMVLMMDPEVVSRTAKDMPKMIQGLMAQMPAIEKKVEAVTADLPKPKEYKDLTPEQRTKLAGLLGVDEKDLGKPSGSAARKGGHTRKSHR
jgi:hypothetical protein